MGVGGGVKNVKNDPPFFWVENHESCLCGFSPWPAQNSKFLKLVFMIL